MDRIIMHIDVNNAFLSWTAVDMLKNGSKIDIRKRYAIIGGDESKRRGIVLAKSNLCKQKGVYTSQTIYSARKLCPYLDVYKPNYNLYKKYSNYLFEYLSKYTNIIERYSIDECFLDYTSVKNLYGDPIKFAYKIKNEISSLYGFTVNVGIGNNKLCAKMASDFSKPNKVHTLFLDEIKDKMWPLDVSELFMIGKRSSEKLKNLNINTIYDLAHTPKAFLEEKFKKMGTMMWEYANGIDNSNVEYLYENPKSISNSTVLPYDYRNMESLHEVLKELCMHTIKRLNEVGMYTNNVGIWVKYSNMEKKSIQKKLENSTNDFDTIYKQVIELFSNIYNEENDAVRSLCVSLNDLDEKKRIQLSIFDKVKDNLRNDRQDEKINKVIDEMKAKYGKDLIKIGVKNVVKK